MLMDPKTYREARDRLTGKTHGGQGQGEAPHRVLERTSREWWLLESSTLQILVSISKSVSTL
jgi:hypothetical protein